MFFESVYSERVVYSIFNILKNTKHKEDKTLLTKDDIHIEIPYNTDDILWAALVKLWRENKRRTKILVRNQQKYDDDEDMSVVLVAPYFGVASINFADFQKIIGKIDSISHSPLTDGNLRVSFGIRDVFVEVDHDKQHKPQ